MLRSLKILMLLLVCSTAYGQDTIPIGDVYNFVPGIQIDSVEIKQITFYGSDSLQIISGDNDTIMAGGTGGVSTETDPVYNSEPASSITAQDLTDIGNLSGTNTGDQDLSGYQQDADTTTFDGTKHDVDTSLTNAKNYTDTEIGNLNFIAPGDTANMLAPYAKSSEIPVDDSVYTLKRSEQIWDSIAFSSTINVDFTSGADYKIIGIAGDCTINFIDMPAGESIVWLIYDGAHTVTKGTNWNTPGDLKGGGSLDETSGAINIIQLQKAVGPGGYEKIVHMILN